MAKTHKSIKRHEALKSFSREHRTGLALCWNLKMGLRKNINPHRMKEYIDFMWKDHLKNHFADEERLLFPVFGHDHELIIKAIEDHETLRSIFNDDLYTFKTLADIAQKLEEHIRFEERTLFNILQDQLSEQQIETIMSEERDSSCGLWDDMFWK